MTKQLDVIVVGAGPCGIAVGAAAEQAGLSCMLIEKGCISNSLVSYPYYMTFFSTAVMLEVGGVPFAIPNANLHGVRLSLTTAGLWSIAVLM